MFASFSQKKALWLCLILAILATSLSITLSYDNSLSDGISISVSALASISLLLLASIWLFDIVNDICNP
jgi:hypothetical protein